jgi:chemotaxis protein CheD
MVTADHIAEVFLQPGDLHFGGGRTRIRTLLGSCVAIALWHPRLRIGGMCHYVLPTRQPTQPTQRPAKPEGRYAEEAIAIFLRELHTWSTQPSEYEAKLFGGGNMFPDQRRQPALNVSDRNIEAGRAILLQHGFRITAEHLGGSGRRQVLFELWSGHVWLRYDEAGATGGGGAPP